MRLCWIPLVGLLLVGCASNSTTEPRTTDVNLAYSRWSASHPASYSFDVSIDAFASSNGFIHVTVANGQVVQARQPYGAPDPTFTLTIDTLWNEILAARQNGSLHSAEFSLSGVPLDVDMGDWALDSGVHYTIRNFSVTR